MISKELLSAVLNDKVSRLSNVNYQNVILYDGIDGDAIAINIYELAHKCKIWANNKGYIIDSNLGSAIGRLKGSDIKKVIYTSFDVPHEQELIFATCQWILENKDGT